MDEKQKHTFNQQTLSQKKNGHLLTLIQTEAQEQHPFHFLSLYYALIEKGCRDQVTITMNSKTLTPGTTKSRRPRGRMPIGEFCCRPTYNLNLFEPQMRYKNGLLLYMSVLLGELMNLVKYE